MARKAKNLDALLQANPDALEFFNQLPGYVRDHIRSRGDNVRTFSVLQDYAENLLRGDG